MGTGYYDLGELELVWCWGILPRRWPPWCQSERHLQDVGMSYWAHGLHALKIAWLLAGGALRAIVHAAVPGWYESCARDSVAAVSDMLQQPSAKPQSVCPDLCQQGC